MQQEQILNLKLKLKRGYAGLPRRKLCLHAPVRPDRRMVETAETEDDTVGEAPSGETTRRA